ncbi:hypothetical protein L798_08496 [Zootermopsis nevadensis]|uniref:Uncharacterized protein n=1 Tax=Zootermopsis nevadensis TaxID=136037 RepID=A0A067R3J9_ZOONE|nr:hypothetical protein L798_08496 [Zootermopsis nevadensis]
MSKISPLTISPRKQPIKPWRTELDPRRYSVAPPMNMLPSNGPNSSSGSKSTI